MYVNIIYPIRYIIIYGECSNRKKISTRIRIRPIHHSFPIRFLIHFSLFSKRLPNESPFSHPRPRPISYFSTFIFTFTISLYLSFNHSVRCVFRAELNRAKQQQERGYLNTSNTSSMPQRHEPSYPPVRFSPNRGRNMHQSCENLSRRHISMANLATLWREACHLELILASCSAKVNEIR